MEKRGYVYIMASGRNGTLYIGVTSDLPKRVWEHRQGAVEGFTRKYGCKTLVWYEVHDDIQGARHRESQMKKWKRLWKLSEIEKMNPDWNDLFESLQQLPCAPAKAGAQSGSLPLQGHKVRDGD